MIKHSSQIGCVQTICPRHLRRAVWRLQGLSLMNSWKHFKHQAGMFSSMIWIPNRVTITTNKWDGAQVGVSIYLILSWFDNRVDLNTSTTDTSRQTLFDFICNFFTTSAQPQAWMPCSSTNSGHLISTSTTQGQAENLCQQFFIMPRTLKIPWRAHGEDFGWRRRKREPRFIQGGFCLSALSLLSVLSVLLVLSHPEEAVLYSRWQSPWSWICRWPAQWMYPTSPSTRTLASSSSPALAGGRF